MAVDRDVVRDQGQGQCGFETSLTGRVEAVVRVEGRHLPRSSRVGRYSPRRVVAPAAAASSAMHCRIASSTPRRSTRQLIRKVSMSQASAPAVDDDDGDQAVVRRTGRTPPPRRPGAHRSDDELRHLGLVTTDGCQVELVRLVDQLGDPTHLRGDWPGTPAPSGRATPGSPRATAPPTRPPSGRPRPAPSPCAPGPPSETVREPEAGAATAVSCAMSAGSSLTLTTWTPGRRCRTSSSSTSLSSMNTKLSSPRFSSVGDAPEVVDLAVPVHPPSGEVLAGEHHVAGTTLEDLVDIVLVVLADQHHECPVAPPGRRDPAAGPGIRCPGSCHRS